MASTRFREALGRALEQAQVPEQVRALEQAQVPEWALEQVPE
jgi:hypothetical protein